MKKLKNTLIFSLIITLPINVFGVVWLTNSLTAYFAADELNYRLEKHRRLLIVADTEFLALKTKTLNLFGIRQPADVELIIKEKDLAELSDDLPRSGTHYKKDSFLIMDGVALKGSARFRGDHSVHWGFPRKSWRFKASKKNVINGIHKYNFIMPKSDHMLNNHLSYLLAKHLGLLAPDSRLVEMSINGNYTGPRLMAEQIDESFLRKNKRMPNDIYKGDNIGLAQYVGVDAAIFKHASIWDKAAVNNHYDAENRQPLADFISHFGSDNYAMPDPTAFAAFLAYIDLTGSFHHDRVHNWFLLYDAYHEKMLPIVWDTVGWNSKTVELNDFNISSSPVFEYLYANQQYRIRKVRTLLTFFQQHSDMFLEQLKQQAIHAKSIIKNNGYAYNLEREKLTAEQAMASVTLFEAAVNARLARVQDHFLGPINPANYSYAIADEQTIRIHYNGDQLANGITLLTEQPITQQPQQVLLGYHQSQVLIQHDITQQVSWAENSINITVDLLANRQQVPASLVESMMISTPGTYELTISGFDTRQLKDVVLSFENTLAEQHTLERTPELTIKPFEADLKYIVADQPNDEVLILAGDIDVTEDTVYHQPVHIKAGTNFLIAGNSSLKFLGQVTAIGTAEQPITFKPKDHKTPWNAVVIKDQGANGSTFKHCEFVGGSGDKGALFEYTAMLSIHNVRDIAFEHCGFYDSKITDDMIHVIYSEASFSHSVFVRSLADAVDADISELTISHCEFIDNGNDSIDLMTARAVVHNTRFLRSADKGISIGEGSQLLAYNNTIIDSEIGMQSKDTSLAYIYDTTFIGNNTAVDAYHKNWRYSEGGQITLENCHLERNIEHATVGKKSTITLNNCDIHDASNISRKDQNKNKITISQEERIEHQLKGEFFKNFDPSTIQGAMNGSH